MWFVYALVAALATACLIIVGKRLVTRLDPFISVFLGFGFSLVFLFLAVIATKSFPAVTALFFGLSAVSATLDAVAHTVTLMALRKTSVSIVSPITSFTPVFTVFFGFVILHEQPTPLKLVGITAIVGGAYFLNLGVRKKHWLEPVRHLVKDHGVWMVLLACLIWGLTPIVQKQQIFQTTPTTPLFASFVSFLIMVLLLAPIALTRIRRHPRITSNQVCLAIVFGLLASVATYFGWTAFSITNTSYVVAIGKMSIVFSVILAGLIIREKISRERWIGVVVMTMGAIALVV